MVYFWELKGHAQTLLNSKGLFSDLESLLFELELFKSTMAFHFLARKPVSRDQLTPKFALAMIYMCPS